MKQKDAGRDMRLRVQTANQMLKHNVQTQDADAMQDFFFCIIYDTNRGYISTILHFKGLGEGWLRTLDPPRFRLGSGLRHASF